MPRYVLLHAAAFAAMAAGQVRIQGHVISDTNAPLANAGVTLHSAKTAEHHRVYTDAAGAFTIALPLPGDYLVDVELSGFFALRDRPISVAEGTPELKLILAPVREFSDSVDVSASNTGLTLEQTATPEKMNSANLLDVPYPTTQNLKNAMRILPGVVQDSTGGIHVNGGREDQALYLFDGFNVTDPLTGTLEARVSVEAVQAMDVFATRSPAEYGKSSAGIVTVNTKMGDDKFRYSSTNFIPGVESAKGLRVGSWNPRLNLSGPIQEGRAWFSDSLTLQYDQTVIRELPAGQDAATSWRYSNLMRGQFNVTPSNILYAGLLTNQWSANRTGLGALDPPETTVDRRSRQWFADIKDQVYFAHGALLEAGFASYRTFLRQVPQGHNLYILTPEGRRGNFFVNGVQEASRAQGIVNVFLPSFNFGGTHQLKTGTDLNRVEYDQDIHRTGFEFYSADALVRRVLYSGNGIVGKRNLEAAAYVQDAWRVRPNVLVEIGLRGDRDDILRNWNVSPRAGIAWSPRRLENTRISGGYAVTYDATNLRLFTRPYDQVAVTTFFPPYGLGAPVLTSSFQIPHGEFASPRYSTWSGAVDQRAFSNVILRMQALRRSGHRGLTYVDSANPGASAYVLSSSRRDTYDSVEFTVRQNLHKQYEWLASYTRSRALSSAVMELASDVPAIVPNNRGRLHWDAPNRAVSWGYLPTLWKDWAIAYLAEYHDGFPFSVQDNTGRIVEAVNSRRYPNFFELNLHVERTFRFRGQLWAGRAGFNNITNHRNPNAVNNDIDAERFLQYFGGQRRALVFRIRWLGKL